MSAKQKLVLRVFRRVWVAPVTVAIPNSAIWPVDNDLSAFSPGDFSSTFRRFTLRPSVSTITVSTFATHRPTITTRNDMQTFGHIQLPFAKYALSSIVGALTKLWGGEAVTSPPPVIAAFVSGYPSVGRLPRYGWIYQHITLPRRWCWGKWLPTHNGSLQSSSHTSGNPHDGVLTGARADVTRPINRRYAHGATLLSSQRFVTAFLRTGIKALKQKRPTPSPMGRAVADKRLGVLEPAGSVSPLTKLNGQHIIAMTETKAHAFTPPAPCHCQWLGAFAFPNGIVIARILSLVT